MLERTKRTWIALAALASACALPACEDDGYSRQEYLPGLTDWDGGEAPSAGDGAGGSSATAGADGGAHDAATLDAAPGTDAGDGGGAHDAAHGG